ncbi:MAG: universal stress protein [Proteobacteria bacterium]|nr:universal stress protein [Pseudomonadota bacterium]
MYKRILVPVDGSKTSGEAFDAALQLAKESASQVQAVHVVDTLIGIGAAGEFGGYPADLLDLLREDGKRLLAEAQEKAKAAGVEVETALVDDFGPRLGEAVADAAKRWKADLIVIGTHGRRGIGRVLLGSGAEQIIRLAPVPVLVVRGKTHD